MRKLLSLLGFTSIAAILGACVTPSDSSSQLPTQSVSYEDASCQTLLVRGKSFTGRHVAVPLRFTAIGNMQGKMFMRAMGEDATCTVMVYFDESAMPANKDFKMLEEILVKGKFTGVNIVPEVQADTIQPR